MYLIRLAKRQELQTDICQLTNILRSSDDQYAREIIHAADVLALD